MGMIQPNRDGKERVFMDEKQHVQMPGGGHIVFMENMRGLIGLKTPVGIGESGRGG